MLRLGVEDMGTMDRQGNSPPPPMLQGS